MSIMDTLITNRTQADVIAGNAKGNYNASDLNRVGEAEEYLHDLFESYGYSMPNYKRIKLQRPGHYETQTVKKPILPDGYTQLEYIDSTGEQYFDLGVDISNGWHFRTDVTFTGDGGGFFGCEGMSGGTSGTWGRNDYLYSSGWGHFVGYGGYSYAKDFKPGIRMNLEVCNIKDNISVKVDNTAISLTQGSGETGYRYPGAATLLYVRCYQSSTYDSKASAMLYSFKLYSTLDDSKLIRDMVPAKRNSDGVIGLYDLVSNSFFENAGTGVFTAGPENIEYETITEEVLVPDERDPYTWFEDDIPTSGMMAQYITNLSELRGQFSQTESTPAVPSDMEGISWREANDIEKILEDVDALLTNIAAAWFYSGDLFSGEV